eukprot:180367-Pelagomonas_calceolata.AAC.5
MAVVRLQRAPLTFQVSGNNNIFPSTIPWKTFLRAQMRCGQDTKLLYYLRGLNALKGYMQKSKYAKEGRQRP